jgi:hypothetical protein
MNATPENSSTVIIRPPQLIQSLLVGFNTVATHIYLIILPILLDLLLWFGPHIRLKKLMEPGLLDLMSLMRSTSSVDMRPILDNMETIWKLFLEQYNLVSMVSTFPVGIPTLMGSQLPIRTPLGAPAMIEVNSFGQFFLGWVFLTLLGFLLGSVYFALLANSCGQQFTGEECVGNPPLINPEAASTMRVPPLHLGSLGWQAIQVFALAVLLLLIGLMILIPTLLLATFIALLSPILAQMVLLLIMFSSLWLLIPLVFSPHGIFMCGQSVFHAMFNSTRVVRFILPGTGLFLLAVIILNQGLGVLWTTPPDTSWMALVGIFGHAFIITGLLAASFIYYRNGLTYVQSLRKLTIHS